MSFWGLTYILCIQPPSHTHARRYMYCHYKTTSYVSCSWFFNLHAHYAAQYASTFRAASTEAVSYDLSRGLPTGIFYYARFIFVQYVRVVLQGKPDVKLSYVILCWINPCLSLSLSLYTCIYSSSTSVSCPLWPCMKPVRMAPTFLWPT